ncbi:MAG: tetratricopeptide repeat protein [Candidatus Obscuribacterales bacterium]|nr:tetratricopeptide repeat protein [Candidatus Obscuribacterales bacterium]
MIDWRLNFTLLLAFWLLVAQNPASAYGLKALKPIEDISTYVDPAEIYADAVREYQAGALTQAESLFKKVLSLSPGNAAAEFNLGAIAEKRQNWSAALAHYQSALKKNPQDEDCRAAVADMRDKIKEQSGSKAKAAFARGAYLEAASELNKLSTAAPDAQIEFALGQSFRGLKYYLFAAYHLKMAIFLDPENESYRKSLVELDQEIIAAQEKAFSNSAILGMSHLRLPFGAELAGGP